MTEEFEDVMVDLETLGKAPGCAILSVGAVGFDPFNPDRQGPAFYMNIELTSCLLQGLEFDQSTLEWWQQQSSDAIQQMGADAFKIEDVCFDFVDWFNQNKFKNFWCQGATFDAPILEFILRKLDIQVPWKFHAVRDTRTVYDICGYNPYTAKRSGTYHNALDDAHHQVMCVQNALRQTALSGSRG